jgi:hypothetical protein
MENYNERLPTFWECTLITVFCLVVKNIDQILTDQKLRLRGFSPKLTDAEVISMEIIGEFLGIDTDKGIWLYFKTHWQDWFPALGSRSSFVRQASNLWQLKQKLQSMTAKQLNAYFTKLEHRFQSAVERSFHFYLNTDFRAT